MRSGGLVRSRRRTLALTLGLAVGCGGGGGGGPDGGGSDAPTGDAGVVCGAADPRTGPVQLEIGPGGWDAWTDLIDGATTSLDLQMYLFTVNQVEAAVIDAHQRGVAVRVLLDPDHAGNLNTRGDLEDAGVEVRDAPSRFEFSHAKYAIIDGDTAMILSGNFNVDAYSQERNYGVSLTDPDDLEDLQALFDADWTGAPEPDLGCTKLVVSPSNGRSRIIAHIRGAQTRLDIEVSYLSDSAVRTSVVEAKNRGVAVRVILASPEDYEANAAAIQILQNQSIPVRIASGFLLHAKLLLADDAALIGSHNYSTTSMNDNREVGVVVTTPAVISAIEAQFATDWAASTAP
ncbi:MAG: phospholipase D-like domain-containing protein [Kofleriaceae bacterium]